MVLALGTVLEMVFNMDIIVLDTASDIATTKIMGTTTIMDSTDIMDTMGTMDIMDIMGNMGTMDIMDIMDIMDNMDIMDIMDIMEIMDNMGIMGTMVTVIDLKTDILTAFWTDFLPIDWTIVGNLLYLSDLTGSIIIQEFHIQINTCLLGAFMMNESTRTITYIMMSSHRSTSSRKWWIVST